MLNKSLLYSQICFAAFLIAIDFILLLTHASLVSFFIANFLLFGISLALQYMIVRKITEIIIKRENEAREKKDKEFQQSLKTVYDEHIFSITHELRSPLAVVTASLNNQYNTLKSIFNHLPKETREEYKDKFKNGKTQIECIKNQTDIIESFIASISEHASYITNEGDKKYVNLHKYLISVILNSRSFSRNMRIFENDIRFGDPPGTDFMNISVQVSPHDLSRMLTNIMTNAADAIMSSYQYKKQQDPTYKPSLRIRCIKAESIYRNIILTDEFMRINGTDPTEGHPFYLIVEDNGSGISKENITRIFKYRHTTKEKSNDPIETHRGLGLYLTIRLANKNGLKLYARTNEDGTMFAIGFPRVYLGEYTQNKIEEESTDPVFGDRHYISEDSKDLYNKFRMDERTTASRLPALVQTTTPKKRKLWHFLGVF